ncbi:MAG: hypothetical protein AB1306_02795 [Nitrospirota bacterium]
MREFPWYFRSYWYVIEVSLIILLCWLLRKYSLKSGAKIIAKEKYHIGLYSLLDSPDIPPFFTGKEAVEAGRSLAMLGNIFFWIVLFLILIFTVIQFENIFL